MTSSESGSEKATHDESVASSAVILGITAALVVLTVVVFESVRDHQFVNFDDGAYVTENAHVKAGLTAESMAWAFSFRSSEATSNWHPLTWLSLMLDVSLFGENSSAMHLVNVAFHLLNALLVYRLLLITTGRAYAAGFVAAIFSVHPLHVESVAWVSERKDVLSTFFCLLSILAWHRSRQKRKSAWTAVSLILFVCSLASKQMYVTLPVLLLLLDYWPLGRGFEAAPQGELSPNASPLRKPTQLVVEKTPFVLVALIFSVIALLAQSHGGAVGSVADYPIPLRIANALNTYVAYLRQTLWPSGLSVFYPYPVQIRWISAIAAAILLIGISVGVWIGRKRCPWLLVGWLWYVVALLPVIGLVQIGRQSMADRYMYFPMIGVLIAVTWSVMSLIGHDRRWHAGLFSAACLLLLAMTLSARAQVSVWRDSETLFTHAARVAPSSLAFTKLGFEKSQTGKFAEASTLLHRALRLDPDYAAAHEGLGNISLAKGNLSDAIDHFSTTIRLSPDHAEAHYNLGIALSQNGQVPLAITHYKYALKVDPDNPQIHANLGTAYAMLQERSLAAQHLTNALRLSPNLAEAHFTLASVLTSDNDIEGAIEHLHIGLKLRPDAHRAHAQLANLLEMQGNSELAEFHRMRSRTQGGKSPKPPGDGADMQN